MSRKLAPEDFGCLVRPKIPSSAFVLESSHKQDLEAWWKAVRFFDRSNPHYKPTTINKFFGPKPFEHLKAGSYTAQVSSMLLSAREDMFLATSETQVKVLVAFHQKSLKVRAVGLSFYAGLEPVEEITPTSNDDPKARIMYWPESVVRLEECLRYEGLNPGNVLCFPKSTALVVRVAPSKRCGWTNRVVWALKGNGTMAAVPCGKTYSVLC